MYFRACATACLLACTTVHAQAPLVPGRLPTLPLTQLDDRALSADLDNRVFTLTFAQPVAIPDLLLLLVRGTSLSVVPDPGIAGTFIGELKNVTVRQALSLILPPLGLDYAVDGSIVRVFRREPETRLFDINFVAAARRVRRRRRAGRGRHLRPRVPRRRTRCVRRPDAGVGRSCPTGDVQRRSKSGPASGQRFSRTSEPRFTYLDAVTTALHRQVQIDARVIEVN